MMSCESKHVAITTVKSDYLLYWLKINKLNTLTEHNGMDMLKVKLIYVPNFKKKMDNFYDLVKLGNGVPC
jgi:hypothetical protein